MKRHTILGILGALGFSVALSSTALADHRDHRGHRDQRENRAQHRHDRLDRFERIQARREAIRDRRDALERMRRYEEMMRLRRIEARRDAIAWERARAARAAERRQEILRSWGVVYRTPAGRAELAYHGQRMAHLHRLRDLGAQRRDTVFVSRVDRLIQLEIGRNGSVLLKIRSTTR